MSDTPATPRPSHLFKRLPPDRRLRAAEAFWQDENAGVEQADATAAIAQRIRFRLKSVHAMPLDKKVRQLLALPAVSEAVAVRLLVAYHLDHQRAMMGRFLDALGIAHENGLIADENLTAPPADRLRAAAETLASSFPADEVSLYFSTLLWQDSETWGGLADLPQLSESSPAPQRS
ncbi:MAG: hypothetical protein A3I61_18635 [Acidobacteria bacterium RIFCSPLOWO2_02_FULL_68_18]|nr:MAG: hypothetical protein A3I61_18635 [Acidobacteria bacterium RIFCSPLOWO2_02_FULL_68_18]OFW48062.1 MAG: hypothetical protein A3G77_11250 [Acidobacteria bacterium RIFCSPLOWO2_12_FULL_68_19]